MLRVLASSVAFFVYAFGASAQEAPASCAPEKLSPAGATQAEIQAAKLACDVDRAARLITQADGVYGSQTDYLMRIVDTASPSGSAYVYSVQDAGGAFILDARTVPDQSDGAATIPYCQLRTLLPDQTAQSVTRRLDRALTESLPAYGDRSREVINPDGSRTYELLFDTHDIITEVVTENGPLNYSRHADSTDLIALINETVISVANVSDQWRCDITGQDTN